MGNENSGRKKSVDINDPKVKGAVQAFGRVGATQKEMAHYFGVTPASVSHYMEDEEGEFYLTYWTARAELHKSLRTKQIQKALKGDNQMLIWCGKNILEQSDRQALDHTTNGKDFVPAKLDLSPPPFLGQLDENPAN